MKRNGLAILVILFAAGLTGLLAYGVATNGADRSIDAALERGKRVDPPERTLPVLGKAGAKGSLKDYAGKVVVVNFWASWCPPCVSELPLLQRTHAKLTSQNATLLGIDVEDAQSDALDFVGRFKLTYPSLRDYNRDYAQEFGVTGYPETFVLDRKGRIAAKRRGPVDQAWLDKVLPPLLREPA